MKRANGKKLYRLVLVAPTPAATAGKAWRPTFSSQFMGIQMPVITSIVSVAGYMLPFVFVLVIFFHELGHFLIGRWCGVKVETFSLVLGLSYLALMTAMARAGASRRCRLEMFGSMVTLLMPRCRKRPRWPRYLSRNGRSVSPSKKYGKRLQ
jgi:hypothetical protein